MKTKLSTSQILNLMHLYSFYIFVYLFIRLRIMCAFNNDKNIKFTIIV